MSDAERSVSDTQRSPWPALWALVIGFFMILVDVTIVSIATPAIMADLDADVDSVVWVTSGYLLSYAVPLLITGRLGDRFGPRRVYLVGLAIFTLASLWCGLTGSIGALIAARVVQGLGASLDDPADHGGDQPDVPAGVPRRRDEPVGCHGRRRHARRTDARRRARRRVRLAVDLLRQRAGRHRRLRRRLAAGARAAHPRAPLRHGRGRAQRGRHVPAGVRHPGGAELRLERRHLGDDRRRVCS